ncbi:MAG: hypothetical protein KC413_09280, partial [Anaerolineales bacterium]|nr:hypothetical protein [Anaerolineales bacterium]
RWRDEPYIFTSPEQLGVDDTYDGPDWNGYLDAGPPPPVLLAKLTVADNGTFTIDETVRQYSGLRLPGPDSAAPTLRTDANGSVGLWMVHNNDEVEKLTVTADGRLGLGTQTPGAALEINNTLTATSTAKTLVGLKISPTFDKDGKTDVKQYGLLVESGLVGIGTTTPATNLEVRGIARAGNSEDNYTEMGHGGANGYINTFGEGRLDFRHHGANKMVLTDSSKLGIGQEAPGAHVDVMGVQNDSNSISLQLRSGNAAANFNSTQITFGHNNTATYRHAIKTRHQGGGQFGNAIDFYVWKYLAADNKDEPGTIGTLHTMTLDGGRVGIGTTAPSEKLEVTGRIKAGTTLLGPWPVDESYAFLGASSLNQSAVINYALLQHTGNGTTFLNSPSSIRFRIKNSDNMIMDEAGNVGIGITELTQKLEVAGAIRATDGLYMDTKSTEPQDSAGWHRIAQGADRGGRNAGIFEIRWGAPGKHGHVRFAVAANFGADNGTQLTILDQSSFSGRIVEKIRLLVKDTYDEHYIEFYFNGSIHNTNKVTFHIYQLSGFGWSLITPTAGAIDSGYQDYELRSDVLFATRSGANASSLFVVDNDANVGIGTTSPTAKLQVNGNIRFGGSDWQLDTGSWQNANIRYHGSEDTATFGFHGESSKKVNVVIDGSLTAPNIVQTEEALRTIRGTVEANGDVFAGSGYTVNKVATGLYDVSFATEFSNIPTVVVTQQHPDNNTARSGQFTESGGNTRDNAVVVGVRNNKVRIRTGKDDGSTDDRRFHFIAIGPR